MLQAEIEIEIEIETALRPNRKRKRIRIRKRKGETEAHLLETGTTRCDCDARPTATDFHTHSAPSGGQSHAFRVRQCKPPPQTRERLIAMNAGRFHTSATVERFGEIGPTHQYNTIQVK